MKKSILYVSVIGLNMIFVAYLVNKRSKSNVSKNKFVENDFTEVKSNRFEQGVTSVPDVAEEITNVKNASAHSIHGRHTEAANIMHSAFENIYKDIEPVESDGKKDDSGAAESVITKSELNSLSDKLDDLLR